MRIGELMVTGLQHKLTRRMLASLQYGFKCTHVLLQSLLHIYKRLWGGIPCTAVPLQPQLGAFGTCCTPNLVPHGARRTPNLGLFGACFQTSVLLQNFPNAINTAAFPDSVLKPGHKYQNTCVWRFGTVPAQTRMRKLVMGLGLVLALAAVVTAYRQCTGSGSRHRWHGFNYLKA